MKIIKDYKNHWWFQGSERANQKADRFRENADGSLFIYWC